MLIRSRNRDRSRGGSVALSSLATGYLNGVTPYHYADYITNRMLYAGADVGTVAGGTGYSFTRASDGYYTNSDGTLTNFASGALRRGDRGVLIEGARTNLLLRSTFAGGGAAPTGWTQPTATGTSAPVTSTLNPDIVAYEHVAAAERPYFNQSVTLTSNTTYTLSVYIEAVTGTIALSQFLGSPSWPSGATVTEDSLGNLAAGQRRTIVISGTYTGAATNIRVGIGIVSNATGTVRFSMPQLEAASFPSSYIPTVAASATRAADSLSYTAGVSYPLQLWSEFERAVDTGGSEFLMTLSEGANDSNRSLLMVSASDLARYLVSSGAATQADLTVAGALALNTVYKISARTALNDVQMARGGTLGTQDTSALLPSTPTLITIGSAAAAAASQPFGYIRRIAIIQGAGTDANLQAMTS